MAESTNAVQPEIIELGIKILAELQFQNQQQKSFWTKADVARELGIAPGTFSNKIAKLERDYNFPLPRDVAGTAVYDAKEVIQAIKRIPKSSVTKNNKKAK